MTGNASDYYERFLKDYDRINIRFCGQGGQGIILMAYLFGKAAIFEGLESVQTQRYGPESRGSPVKSDVVVSNGPIKYPLFKNINLLVAMNQEVYHLNHYQITNPGLIIIDNYLIQDFRDSVKLKKINATKISKDEFGTPMMANVVLLGFLSSCLPSLIKEENFLQSIEESVRTEYVKKNLKAFKMGRNYSIEKK